MTKNLQSSVNLKDRVGDAVLTDGSYSVTIPVTRDDQLNCFVIHLPEAGQIIIYDGWLYKWTGLKL